MDWIDIAVTAGAGVLGSLLTKILKAAKMAVKIGLILFAISIALIVLQKTR